MPFIIHIPAHYQRRTYFIAPPSYCTSAPYIAVSTDSPLAQTIAKDAETWGWRVVFKDPADPVVAQKWVEYVKEARRRGWYVHG
jgi:hypothetical protein